MPTPAERFEVLAPLPSLAGFRRALAVDRGGPPRAVVLAYPPARVADDPARLVELVGHAEAAAHVHHPNVASVLGLETVGEVAAVVEVYVGGPTLRDLLDAGGRLPPDVAGRAIADACAGVARVHAVDPGDGRPFSHGALGADRLVIGEDGLVRVTGLGTTGGGDLAADLRALGAVLHECLAGEPPASPARPLEGPGIPPALAKVVDRALGVAPGAPTSAAALGAEIEAAFALASPGGVAAYAEAILPAEDGDRAALARLLARALAPAVVVPDEVSADLIVEDVAQPVPEAAPLVEATPVAAAPAALEPAAPTPAVPVVPAAPAPQAAPVVPALQAAPAAVPAPIATPSPAPAPAIALPLAETAAPPAPARPPLVAPAVAVEPTPLARPESEAALPPDAVKTFPAPKPAQRRSRAPLVAAAVFGAAGLALGFAVARGRLPLVIADMLRATATAISAPPPTANATSTATSTPAPASTPTPTWAPSSTSPSTAPAPHADLAPPAKRAKPAAPARRVASARPTGQGKGRLEVNAPAEADVFLDGHRIGKGSLKTEIADGAHRIEVRLGEERAGERFTLEPGETWTYDVTQR